jgi:hypothetical protein
MENSKLLKIIRLSRGQKISFGNSVFYSIAQDNRKFFFVIILGLTFSWSENNFIFSCLLYHKMIEWYRGSYIIAIDEKELETYKKNKTRQRVKIEPKSIKWMPKDWSKRVR